MDTRMDARLRQYAESGDIDALYTLIRENVQLLEHIDKLPFADTPLHIAASAGQITFAVETMGLKPSFARKLDPNGFSPIHLALQNGHIELVRRLLQLDGDLVRVKGRERLTPLHYVVESGEHLNLLDEFLLLCPDSITDVTVRNETVLHIALKHIRLKAFQFFVGWLAKYSSENAEFNKRKVLNWKDNEGNTVLHILVSTTLTQAYMNQLEPEVAHIQEENDNLRRQQEKAGRHLLSWCEEFVDVNHKNLENKTAWDILQEDSREIRDMLRHAGAKPGSSLSTFNSYPNEKYQEPLTVSWVDSFWPKNLRREIRKFTEERRNMLLVVAALLATLSFQAVLTPPGGLWQDNGLCITTKADSYNEIPLFNETVGRSNYPKNISLIHSNNTLMCEHKAGTAIALGDYFFKPFLFINTGLFSLSNSLIVLLILHFFMKILFHALSIILLLSYCYTVWTITDDQDLMLPLVSVDLLLCFYTAFILEAMIRLSAIPQQHTKQGHPLIWKEPLF